jgi:ubiquinone/menaquinone biosynthesis C-methylase UbiE
MQQTINEVSRVLKPGGQAVYVVGENTVRGTYIQNSKIVTALAEQSGLTFIERRARLLPQNRRYLPPPATNGNTDSMNGRMRREIVLAFRK